LSSEDQRLYPNILVAAIKRLVPDSLVISGK